MTAPDDDAVEWLTYAEMSARLGITVGSARTLTKRHRWPRRTGNDGLARIAVPASRIEAAPRNAPSTEPPIAPEIEPPADLQAEPRNDPPSHLAVQLARAEGEIEGLRAGLARAEALADRHREDAERERERTWGLVAELRAIAGRMAEAEAARARPWWRRALG